MIPAALGSGRLGWPGLVALVALALAAATLIAWPALAGPRGEPGDDAAEGMEEARDREDLERSLAALREIAFDHASGNLSDEDFSQLDGIERAKAVALMRRIDEHQP